MSKAQKTALVTLDTNCVVNMFDRASTSATSFGELAALIRHGLSGEVEVAVTTRVEADIANDKDPGRRVEMLRTLQMLPVVGTVARWGVSTWDGGDTWAGKDTRRLADDVRAILFPGLQETDRRYRNKLNDIDHLVGHLLNRRDLFVTDDTGILKRREELKRGPGLIVMSPSECIAYIDEAKQRKAPRTLPSERINPAYHSSTFRGSVTFDYSNNNHHFAIGDGQFLFETQWSKASNASIHAYSNSPSVTAIAVAKDAQALNDILDCVNYDFSSRVRTVKIGEIVVWRNANDIYAATKILAIKDNTRGHPCDELSFEYVFWLMARQASPSRANPAHTSTAPHPPQPDHSPPTATAAALP